MFEPYLTRWHLIPDGAAIQTYSSDLLPVRWQGRAAMLKLAHSAEEQIGGGLMVWLSGDGAARVYAHDQEAILLERLDSELTLTGMVQAGQDDQATQILCAAVKKLHQPRPKPLPTLRPLDDWFGSLERAAALGGMFQTAWATAQALLSDPQEVRPLHGDIHHGNVLHSERGWLAIDPKGLLGERGYDYANIFCNPDMTVALSAGRLARQTKIVAESAGLERERLLRWVLAYAGLSAAWWAEDGEQQQVEETLEIARLAAGELG